MKFADGITRQQAQIIAHNEYQEGGARYRVYKQNFSTGRGSMPPYGWNNREVAERHAANIATENNMCFVIDGSFTTGEGNAWINKWNREHAVCEECKKHGKCTAIDRMNTRVCQNLYKRLGNHYTHKSA